MLVVARSNYEALGETTRRSTDPDRNGRNRESSSTHTFDKY
jgi:hypothetical protein